MEVVVKENPILPYEFTFIILSHGKLTGTKLQCEYNVPITNPLPTQYIRLFSNISEYMFNVSGKDSLNSISRYNKYEVLYKFIIENYNEFSQRWIDPVNLQFQFIKVMMNSIDSIIKEK